MTNLLEAAVFSVQLLLPAFSDFARKLELDVPLPLSEHRITRSSTNRQNSMMLTFDKRHQFNFNCFSLSNLIGDISYTDRKFAKSVLQERRDALTDLASQASLIDEQGAFSVASNALHRIGYDFRALSKKKAPRTQQFVFTTNQGEARPLPFFFVSWHPREELIINPQFDWAVEIQVSDLTKKITYFSQLEGPRWTLDLARYRTNQIPQSPP